jgi:steroid 5-alpha reductase family enzyme
MKTEILVLGFVGGIMPDILRIIVLRFQGAPNYLKSWFFWVSFFVLGILGGFTCWLVEPMTTITAFAVGYSAPSILERLGSEAPKGLRDRSVDRSPSDIKTLREWWGM